MLTRHGHVDANHGVSLSVSIDLSLSRYPVQMAEVK
jgi:hypothetical protein